MPVFNELVFFVSRFTSLNIHVKVCTAMANSHSSKLLSFYLWLSSESITYENWKRSCVICNLSFILFLVCLKSQGIPPVKKEGEKKEEQANSLEGKGIASRIIGPFKPVRTNKGRGNFSMTVWPIHTWHVPVTSTWLGSPYTWACVRQTLDKPRWRLASL